MRIIKLGGSLLESGQMFDCLKHILKSNEKNVVVCGGGEFANHVRSAQKTWHFDDIAAHEMAILAMKQVAIMLQNRQPEFMLESTISHLENHLFSIWSPDIHELNAAKIQPSWGITSDSLAAWLATKLDAEKLIVVKSCETAFSLSELTENAIVDNEFEQFISHAKFDLHIISAEDFLNT
jgi:aspartokinase-like uncharacterized kinase